jgi:hypothetical protein
MPSWQAADASDMGERLAKDVEALFAASVEQRPEWRRIRERGNTSPQAAVPVLVEMLTAMKTALLFIAREVDDAPRGEEP